MIDVICFSRMNAGHSEDEGGWEPVQFLQCGVEVQCSCPGELHTEHTGEGCLRYYLGWPNDWQLKHLLGDGM